jgi:hypothetical protein
MSYFYNLPAFDLSNNKEKPLPDEMASNMMDSHMFQANYKSTDDELKIITNVINISLN